jgi:catechol 2,3-dioxygenase-like lactoylglutathione lyase family enzyme
MRGLALFVAGVVVGIFMMQPSAGQQERLPGMRLNHVGIFAKDFDESLNFYTKTMGFREAFVLKNKEGKPGLAYLQIDRNTFLELAPANENRPAGLNHVGIWVDDLNSTVAQLRERGVKVTDPHTGTTHAPIANVMDPNGVRLELVEFTPDSMQRKAIDSYK